MLLCDIGNSSYHFLEDDREYKKSITNFEPATIKQRVYYICVNHSIEEKLQQLDNWVDISLHVQRDNCYYETMGIDRIIACEAIEDDAIILDAGSALTVDIVRGGVFQGGFIYPGTLAMQKNYKSISLALDYQFNFDIDFKKLPKNSQDAISYGYLKTLYQEVISYNLPIILTGGDANIFLKIFKNATVDELLLFKGMKRVMKKSGYGSQDD